MAGYRKSNGGSRNDDRQDDQNDERDNRRGNGKKPVFKRRVSVGGGYAVDCAVHEKIHNEGTKDEYITYFVSARKSFYDDKAKEWQESNLFNPAELLVLADCVKDCYAFVVEQTNRE